jgi:hypothetical protein
LHQNLLFQEYQWSSKIRTNYYLCYEQQQRNYSARKFINDRMLDLCQQA